LQPCLSTDFGQLAERIIRSIDIDPRFAPISVSMNPVHASTFHNSLSAGTVPTSS
jgi:hypothetical protein